MREVDGGVPFGMNGSPVSGGFDKATSPCRVFLTNTSGFGGSLAIKLWFKHHPSGFGNALMYTTS